MVIPTWNGGERFEAVLAALDAQDVPFELVVIDSGSRDGSAERAAAYGAYVERIPQREFSHGRTRNLGLARTAGEVCLLLTQDALPMDETFVRRLADTFRDPAVDGAYARQFPRDDCDPLLAERLRRWSASRSEKSLQSLVPGDPEASARRFEELEPLQRYLTCAFDNVASAVRRSSWERHPLPERSFGEDVAWAREVLLEGGTLCFEPWARVEHSHRIDLRRECKRLYCDHKNLIALFGLRNVPSWKAVFAGWRHQRRFYWELLAGQRLPFFERFYWKAYAVPYAFAETAAQFLGARSHWKVRESSFWRWFDERVQRGV